jgi:colanic acid/amylovoran biosynthesis glycosyltransferase
MRLVLIVPRFPRLSETFIVNKFVGLVDAGWDVHIVCQTAAPEEWAKFPPLAGRPELQARVHAQWPHDPRWMALLLWLPALLVTLIRAPRTTWRYWCAVWPRFGLRSLKQFYLDAILIALSPDILHFEFGALAVGQTYLKKALGCRLSASFRGYDLSYAGLENPDYYTRLWENADAFHVLGRDLWRRALQRGCPPDKPHVFIPPAIDVDYFIRDHSARRVDPIGPDRPLRVLSVGRLEWVKGYEYALAAMRLLRDRGIPFEYRVIGDGSYLEPLTFARHEMGLEDRVQFLGAQPHPVVMEEMNWADVFLHTSVSEGFCNAVLEAQAMRLPVVASDADGLPENVADGLTGLIASRRDPAALADKLIDLAGGVERRRAMGAAGRARVVDCFALPQQIAAFDRFYREMVNGHGH